MVEELGKESHDYTSVGLLPNKQKWEMLSKELKVAVAIQTLNNSGEIPHFTSITRYLLKFNVMSKTAIHNALDHLIDLGTIDAEWINEDNKWVRRFSVIGESWEFINKLIDELYIYTPT